MKENDPIGFFDSGIGGLTVMAQAAETLKGEKFIYFGDSANAPYGEKDVETVRKLSMNSVRYLVNSGVKAIVVACNTATSASIDLLRESFDIPIIGMEPALRPAVLNERTGTIVVMATPLTIKEKKFNSLLKKYSETSDIIPLPCPGLAELIEWQFWEEETVNQSLKNLFSNININDITDIVLGCTHYIFIKKQIENFFGNKVRIIDGNLGAVMQLKKLLNDRNLLNDIVPDEKSGFEETVEINFSSNKDSVLDKCIHWIKENYYV